METSVYQVRKAIILKARYKILYDSVRQQGESIYALVIVCHNLYQFILFSSQKKFCKKGVIVVIGMLHSMNL